MLSIGVISHRDITCAIAFSFAASFSSTKHLIVFTPNSIASISIACGISFSLMACIIFSVIIATAQLLRRCLKSCPLGCSTAFLTSSPTSTKRFSTSSPATSSTNSILAPDFSNAIAISAVLAYANAMLPFLSLWFTFEPLRTKRSTNPISSVQITACIRAVLPSMSVAFKLSLI